MTEQCKGWGIHIESVEITDVKCMSAALFKDLQAEFREQKKKDASCFTQDINNEIDEKSNEVYMAMKKINDSFEEKLSKYNLNS